MMNTAELQIQQGSNSDRTWFYFKKAQVAQYLGKSDLAREALRQAIALSKHSPAPKQSLRSRLQEETEHLIKSGTETDA